MLASGAIAAVHLGVEWVVALAPARLPCPALPAAASVEEMLRCLPAPTVPCDAPAYPLAPLPLSFAALNLIYAAAVGAVALAAALRRSR